MEDRTQASAQLFKLQTAQLLELQYADDGALVANTPDAPQASLTAVARASSRMGLCLSTTERCSARGLQNLH